MSNPPKPSPKSKEKIPVSRPDNVNQKPRRTGKAGPTATKVSTKDNLKKPKVGAPKIKAPGTEDMVESYNANNSLRVLTSNPPTYRNYITDGTTDV